MGDVVSTEVGDGEGQRLSGLDDLTVNEAVMVFDLLRQVDPAPEVPVDEVHGVGLARAFDGLLRRIDDEHAELADDRAVRRVLRLLGDRASLAVGPDGVTVHSLLRRREVPWSRIQRLAFANRYDLLRAGAIERWIRDAASGGTGITPPGFEWLSRKVLHRLSDWIEQRLLTEEGLDQLREQSGPALVAIERRGRDIQLSGSTLLVSILAPGTCDAIIAEATLRGIPVASVPA